MSPRPPSPHTPWNFITLALHQALMRIGWIFKTESVIMPLVLDTLGGTAWMRGALPMLNRLGQSLPPLAAVRWVARRRHYKYFLAGCGGLMASTFLLLAAIWRDPDRQSGWLAWVFLGLYLAFFVGVGLHQVAFSTLSAKLVAVRQRGRLLFQANLWGGLGAIGCAWFLIRPWLQRDHAGFQTIFMFAGLLFGLAALTALALREPARVLESAPHNSASALSQIGTALRTDRNLRTLALVAILFGLSYSLFPHYQSLGRARLQLQFADLVPWMIAQNLGVTLFSFPIGWVADRFGNRLALAVLLVGSVAAPLLAVALAHRGAVGALPFALVFLLLGMMPLTMRIVTNLALELAEPERQPLYVSVANLALSLPVVGLSLLVGWLIDLAGYEWCFLAVAAGLVLGLFLVFQVAEPRHKIWDNAGSG